MGRRAEVAAGFTLLELVVALALLAVALAVVTPAIGRGTESLRARAEVAGFAATLRHAREQAITSQRSRRVVIDREAHRVTVITPPDPGQDREIRETRTFSPGLVVEATQAAEVVFDARGGASGADFKLSSGGIVYRVTVDRLTGRVRSVRE
jgi:general secretion pathway protein H